MNDSRELPPVYSEAIHNPLVPMVLRVAVAGNRTVPAEQESAIKDTLRKIYATLHRFFEEISQSTDAQRLYANTPNHHKIRFISSLAEGIDRLAIDQGIISFDHELAAITPFLIQHYKEDFSPKNSVVDSKTGTMPEFEALLQRINFGSPNAPLIELDGNPADREYAYKYCSKVHIEHSDLLIAVHDLSNDQKPTLGTRATVDFARKAGLPVIEIDINEPDAVRIFDYKQSDYVPFKEAVFKSELSRILLFTDIIQCEKPVIGHGEELSCPVSKESLESRVNDYKEQKNFQLTQTIPDFTGSGPIELKKDYPNVYSGLFNLFKKTISAGQHKNSGTNHAPEQSSHTQASVQSFSVPASHYFYSAFLRADRLANYYAAAHRSGFLLIYLFGAMALILAAIALYFKDNHLVVEILVTLELLLLTGISIVYLSDKDKDSSENRIKKRLAKGYHSKWLEYRCLAEFLRPLVYFSAIGRTYPVMSFISGKEYERRYKLGHMGPGSSWVSLYTEMLIRYAGFNHCRLDSEFKKKITHFVSDTWLNSQSRYHQSNARTMEHISERLEHFGLYCFIGTLLALTTKLVVGVLLSQKLLQHGIFDTIAGISALLAIILPVCAATSVAISNHAEFAISKQRSLTMESFLSQSTSNLKRRSDQMNSEEYSQLFDGIAQNLLKEVSDWLEIYEVKKSELA